MKKIILFTLFVNLSVFGFAQKFEAGIAAGTAFYNGDLDVSPSNVFKQMKPVVGVFGRYYIIPSLAIRGQAYFGQLMANEKLYSSSAYRKERGFSFTSPITEASIQAEWHALKFDRSFVLEDEDPFLSLYGFGGAGLSLFNPKTDFNEPNPIIDDVSIDRDAVYSKNTASLIGGAGIKLNVTDRLGIGAELGGRKIFTDYLDGISKLSGAAKDYYFFTTLNLSWKFGGGGGGFSLFNGGGGGGNWHRGGRRVGCPTF